METGWRRTCSVVLERGRDGGGGLGGLLLRGGTELLVGLVGVEQTGDGGGPQTLAAVQVEGGLVPGLDHEVAGLDLAGALLRDVPAVCRAVGHIAVLLRL